MKQRYTYSVRFSGPDNGEWQIIDMGTKGYCNLNDPVVWTMPYRPEHDDLGEPPPEFREKYEALLCEAGWVPEAAEPTVNLVEMIADGDDCAFDQPCAWGHRVEDHAVYCHNERWLYSPRKCRRHQGQSAGGDEAWPHQSCPGFLANPLYSEARKSGDPGEDRR